MRSDGRDARDETTERDGILQGAQVLVVEDDEDACEVLKALFESAGAAVETASSVPAAWDVLSGDREIDLLISDIGLPMEDGYALIERVRGLKSPRGDVPAIALTAYVRGEDRARALRSGFDAHTPKPVDPEHLVALAARVLAQNPVRARRPR